MNAYDFDGVITKGVRISADDIIITGRSFEEASIVYDYLKKENLPLVAVYFNPMNVITRETDTEKSQIHSGMHKVNVLNSLRKNNVKISFFYEDNEIQASLIEIYTKVTVVRER